MTIGNRHVPIPITFITDVEDIQIVDSDCDASNPLLVDCTGELPTNDVFKRDS